MIYGGKRRQIAQLLIGSKFYIIQKQTKTQLRFKNFMMVNLVYDYWGRKEEPEKKLHSKKGD